MREKIQCILKILGYLGGKVYVTNFSLPKKWKWWLRKGWRCYWFLRTQHGAWSVFHSYLNKYKNTCQSKGKASEILIFTYIFSKLLSGGAVYNNHTKYYWGIEKWASSYINGGLWIVLENRLIICIRSFKICIIFCKKL